MKIFDWLNENKRYIHVDGELMVFQRINAKMGGAIMKEDRTNDFHSRYVLCAVAEEKEAI